jgi:hypothetical protein
MSIPKLSSSWWASRQYEYLTLRPTDTSLRQAAEGAEELARLLRSYRLTIQRTAVEDSTTPNGAGSAGSSSPRRR